MKLMIVTSSVLSLSLAIATLTGCGSLPGVPAGSGSAGSSSSLEAASTSSETLEKAIAAKLGVNFPRAVITEVTPATKPGVYAFKAFTISSGTSNILGKTLKIPFSGEYVKATDTLQNLRTYAPIPLDEPPFPVKG